MGVSHVLLAIDPGKTGAIAVFEDGKFRVVHDPQDGQLAPVFAPLLLDFLDFRYRVNVVIEKVNGVPGQSGPAAFNFGDGFGQLKGVCLGLGVPFDLIPPATWKWQMGLRRLPTCSATEFKRISVERAASLWGPEFFHLAKHDGRAEAALIGAYWLRERSK